MKRKTKPTRQVKPTHSMKINVEVYGREVFPRVEFDAITGRRANRCNLVVKTRAYHRYTGQLAP